MDSLRLPAMADMLHMEGNCSFAKSGQKTFCCTTSSKPLGLRTTFLTFEHPRRKQTLFASRITDFASSAPFSNVAATAEYVANEARVPEPSVSLPKFKEGYGGSLLALEEEDKFSDDEDEDYLDSEDEGEEPSNDPEAEDPLAIKNLGLAKQLETALLSRGILKLFPIQEAVMQSAMAGKDVIARAKTGTGKTLAFGIPILDKLTKENSQLERRRKNGPRCLVLAPTRELANQVNRELTESAPHLETLCVYGGVSIEGQIRQLRRGVDIVVGTPGRINDLIQRGSLELDSVQFAVLDEADQMLAVGFEEDVERIMSMMPTNRQTQLFSATMPTWVSKISRKYLNSPVTIDLVGQDEDKISELIRVCCVRVPNSSKRTVLNDLITVYAKGGKSIVFTQTKRDADDVSVSLSRSIGCQALHGDIPQQLREKTLQSFRDGKFGVLVATDVASRGLDIPNVDLVIHYEIPNDAETFVHRSGRTGRAGKSGTAILMYSDSQQRTLRQIEREINSKFERVSAPHVDDILEASTTQVTKTISQVHPELTTFFMETAEKLLAEKGTSALASALAYMSGYTQPPAVRSLITYEEGLMTLRLVRNSGGSLPMTSARQLMLALRDIMPAAADNVGKIRILSDRNTEGAVFDLPEDIAKKLLKLELPDGDILDCPKEMPPVIDDTARFDRGRSDSYGKFSGRDRPRGGSSRGGGSGFRGGGGGGGDRYGGDRYGGDRSSSRYGGGGRGGGGDRSSGYGGERLSRFNDGDSYGSAPSSRPRGGGERFSRGGGGLCFLCNQPGHRAIDCPSKM